MNNWTIAGRIGRDAETREVDGGHLVTNFSVSFDEFVGGEKRTLWVDCSWWGDRGEKTAQYLTKGKSLTVSGKAGVRTYEGNNGFAIGMGAEPMGTVETTRARAAPACADGAGSARRSSLPFGVSGKASSGTNAAGTI